MSAFVTPNTMMNESAGEPSGQVEFAVGEERKNGALDPDHRADEGVDDYQQGELREVFAKTQLDAWLRPARRLPSSRRSHRFVTVVERKDTFRPRRRIDAREIRDVIRNRGPHPVHC